MAVEAYRSTNRARFGGRASKRASARLGETVSALSGSSARASRRTLHWLEADPREVLTIRRAEPPAHALAGPSPDGVPSTGSRGAPRRASEEPAPRPGELAADLSGVRTRVARRRAGVVLRRQLIASAVLGVAVQAFVLAGLIPQWVLVAVLVPLALAVTVALRRPIGLERVARLLDERLALFDQITTALEIERRGTAQDRPLERRALARAAAVLRIDSAQWRVSACRARREWLALGACLALLALLVGLSASGAVGARSSSHAGIAHGPGSGQVASRGTGRGKAGAHNSARSHQPAASPKLGIVSKVNHSGQLTHAERVQLEHGHPRTTAGLHSSKGTSNRTGTGSTTAPSQATHSGISPVSRPSPRSASNHRALTTKGLHTGAPTTPSKKSSNRPGQHPGARGRKSSSTGHTPGGSAAGNAAGRNRLLTGGQTRGRVSQQLQLALPAGYVAVHSSRTGEVGRGAEKLEGGGGHGRSAAVGGGGSTSAGGFVYVPPDGGATAEGRASLLDSYFGSLRRIEEELATW